MKHVLITGGSSGIGKVTAKKLIEAGYKVTILAQEEDKTRAAANELGCGYQVADVSDYTQVEKAIEKVGKVDILVNNAGIWIQGPLETNQPDEIRRVIEVNMLGAINCTRAVAGAMKKRKSGKIINIDSQAGLYARAERSIYAASKWGLTGFIRAMQAELKPYNIAMVGIFPGAIKDTALFDHHQDHRDMSKALDPLVVADAIVYVCNLSDSVNVTEFGIEDLAY